MSDALNIEDFISFQEIKEYKKISSSDIVTKKVLNKLITPHKSKLYHKSDIEKLNKLIKDKVISVNWRTGSIVKHEYLKEFDVRAYYDEHL